MTSLLRIMSLQHSFVELVLRNNLFLLKYKLAIAVMQGDIKKQFLWHSNTNIPSTVANMDDADRNQHEICTT